MSTQKFKKGFTLIELMVVIVIIGILAAIAIPKLFGMTAKAKASEVGPAAGTWSKLTSAYLTETDSTGNFVAIGYTPPGTVATDNESSNTGAFKYASTGSTKSLGSWTATNTTDLNNCLKTTGIWKATQARTAKEPTPVEPIADCVVLTPNFKALR